MLLSQNGESLFQLVVVLLVFVFVVVLCYFTTKWLAGYQKKQAFNKNLSVVETLKLTSDKYIQIIKAGENKYYVVAIGKNEVHKIGELSADELLELTTDTSDNVTPGITSGFSEAFNRFKNTKK